MDEQVPLKCSVLFNGTLGPIVSCSRNQKKESTIQVGGYDETIWFPRVAKCMGALGLNLCERCGGRYAADVG